MSNIHQELPEFRRRAGVPLRLIRRIIAVNRGVEMKWRRYWLNQQYGVFVSDRAFLAKTAQIQLLPDGIRSGGTVHLSDYDSISDGVILTPLGGNIRLAENVFLGPYCVVYGNGNVTIGKNTLIAGHSFIVANNHSSDDLGTPISAQPETKLGIVIGEDVWVGCGARILDGVTIGNGCVIGAGSVVTKSLPDYAVAVGVPAKVVRKRTDLTTDASPSACTMHTARL